LAAKQSGRSPRPCGASRRLRLVIASRRRRRSNPGRPPPDPFDRYIFADENTEAVLALRQRVGRMAPAADVSYVQGDANARVDDILKLIPNPEHGRVLSFCFLDPYKLNIAFETVRTLAADRPMDFLILLALHVDANRNLDRYVQEESPVIDLLLGDRDWRKRWNAVEGAGERMVPFLAEEYSRRMALIGYLPMTLEQMVKVRTYEKRLPLYYLAFFSKHRRGVDFWQEVLKYSDDQLALL
jgi:three-Cys-motif partner protein